MNTMKNKVQIIGHVGAAPEIKKLENGTVIANISVATSESYTNDKGEPAQYELNYDSIETPPVHPNCRCTIIPVLKDTTERSIAAAQKELDELKEYTKDLEELLDIEKANS